MKLTKMLPLAFLMVTTALAACTASSEDDEAAETHEDALRIGVGGTVKTIGDLEGDGYTCRNWPGTTVTECTKFGSPTYTCDSGGRCTVLSTAPQPPTYPTIVGPIPTLVAP